ncbi:Protein of unknown function [Cotesia congregata]|uniref:Uncharacterized protein n=1 Tax=Cotesia congregata TaxID=51543 RepID=A0A8J2EDG4_COTCN|nr:Protein of unknown function [Cotesia congregata]
MIIITSIARGYVHANIKIQLFKKIHVEIGARASGSEINDDLLNMENIEIQQNIQDPILNIQHENDLPPIPEIDDNEDRIGDPMVPNNQENSQNQNVNDMMEDIVEPVTDNENEMSEHQSEDESESENSDDESESENSSDDDENDENENYNPNELLYPDAPLTVSQSNALILTLLVDHNITQTCLRDVINIINLHCPSEGLKKNSVYKFKKHFSLKKNASKQYKKHYYCPSCLQNLSSEEDICNSCAAVNNEKKNPYFIEISVKSQLKELYKR